MAALVLSPEMVLVIVLVVYLTGPVLCVLGLVDVIRRPDWAWPASGQNETLWLILNGVGIVLFFVPFAGVIVALIYLLAIRPKLARATDEQGSADIGEER